METYQTLITSDGSPTLIDPKSGQAMHAREGALSETLYIYGEAYVDSKKINTNGNIGVVGLGMGYIELSILLHWLTSFSNHECPIIHSYEADEKLKNDFTSWLTGKPNPILENVAKLVSQQFGLQEKSLKEVALDFYSRFQWQIHGVLNRDSKLNQKFGLVCYDPFSSSANSELWEEEWLDYFIKTFCDEKCVFSTYAANGRLKRVLNKNGFDLKMKVGFGMKRESTLAIKN